MGRGHVTSMLGRLAIVTALFFVFAGQASAASCWQRLMTDWYDGTIDKTYPIPCYHQAIANMQSDLKIYSSASDDIRRALQRAVVAESTPHATTAMPTTEAASTTPVPTAATTTTPTTTASTPAETLPAKTTPVAHRSSAPPPVAATSKGNSVPLPLLILGGIALLCVALGVAGLLRKRFQSGPPGTP